MAVLIKHEQLAWGLLALLKNIFLLNIKYIQMFIGYI